ncbi:MAG: DUF1801 domain-containing protein [Fimbriimonadaceae bacterium]|nr:DUF1801 domain-containing protein [Fimbriimonadaceae bacterium]QYK55873.1 MAG: DUF1801 domain-containing protein [Fimbriimonadaceae bacterium]
MAKKEEFSAEEKAAMKARAKELKAEAKAGKSREEGEKQLLEAVDEMEGKDREMSERLHAIISAAAPDLTPKTWYGMPAYANKDGKTVVFFRAAGKFKERYMTLGFNELANLDEGNMWPTSFALTDLTKAEEDRVTALVKKAVG